MTPESISLAYVIGAAHPQLRIPNVYAYVRERYLHKERWLGALRNAQTPVQFVWAIGDPVANHAMGKALAEQVPQG